MLTIGFTTKFFTLWDVTKDEMTDAYGRKATRYYYNYIKNISLDEQVARAQYPNAPVDYSLRGNSHFTRVVYQPLPTDVFPTGKYTGKEIAKCEDLEYLLWCVNDGMFRFDEARKNIAENVLINSGLYVKYDCVMMRADEYTKVEENDIFVDQLVADIEKTNCIQVNATSNLSEAHKDGYLYDEDTIVSNSLSMVGDNVIVRLEWLADNVTYMRYNGYEYGLPIKNGKGKRIKNMKLNITVSGYKVIQTIRGKRLIVGVKDFEIIKG